MLGKSESRKSPKVRKKLQIVRKEKNRTKGYFKIRKDSMGGYYLNKVSFGLSDFRTKMYLSGFRTFPTKIFFLPIMGYNFA